MKTLLSDANRDLEKYRKDAHTIFEMKVQCNRAEEQRAAIAREAEMLRSTIDVMTKTHEQQLGQVREDSSKKLQSADNRISELEKCISELQKGMLEALQNRFKEATTAPATPK